MRELSMRKGVRWRGTGVEGSNKSDRGEKGRVGMIPGYKSG